MKRIQCLGNDLDSNVLLGDVKKKFCGEAYEGITITYCVRCMAAVTVIVIIAVVKMYQKNVVKMYQKI